MPRTSSNVKPNILYLPADLSGKAIDSFLCELDQLLQNSTASVVLDCTHISRVLPGHIGTLWQAHIKCLEKGIPVYVGSVSINLERILKSLDLYDYLVTNQGDVSHPEADKVNPVAVHAGPRLHLTFQASVEDINSAMEKFQYFLKGLNVSEILEFELAVVFYEVATNIRNHGQIDRSEKIEFSVVEESKVLVLRFVYAGPEFDPTTRSDEFDPKRAIHAKQRRGLGITMIRRMVDTLRYDRKEKTLNELTLERRIHAHEEGNDVHKNGS